MKKILFVIGIIGIYMLIGNVVVSYNLIPDDAIRIRVIANSNEPEDQLEKEKIRGELEAFLFTRLSNARGSLEAEAIIKESVPEIHELLLASLGNDNYILKYGMNFFPRKEFKGIVQNAGYYPSLVVTIGCGKGANWWCILFPPLCLLEGTEMDEVEYRSLVADLISRFF